MCIQGSVRDITETEETEETEYAARFSVKGATLLILFYTLLVIVKQGKTYVEMLRLKCIGESPPVLEPIEFVSPRLGTCAGWPVVLRPCAASLASENIWSFSLL